MIWSTHLMAGMSSLWLLEVLPPSSTESIVILAGAAALGSLLPDLDAAQSKIKHLSVAGIKPFYLPSEAIFHTLGHRTLLHSLWALAGVTAFAAALLPFTDWRVALALVAGYASHLVLDALNPTGIPLLYPKRKRYHLLPKRWRIVTGSPPEEIVYVLFSLLTLAFLFFHLRAL